MWGGEFGLPSASLRQAAQARYTQTGWRAAHVWFNDGEQDPLDSCSPMTQRLPRAEQISHALLGRKDQVAA
jgi:hypothetical protein